MINDCPLCNHRVSDWQMAGQKASVGKDGNIYHHEHVIDFELRHGTIHRGFGRSLTGITAQSDGFDPSVGWTVGVPVSHPKTS